LRQQFDARPDVVSKNARARKIGENINALRKQLDENNTALEAARKAMIENVATFRVAPWTA